MATLESRIEAKVNRTGDHHCWTGAKKSNGVGVLKVGSRLVTVRRVVWELARGPLPKSGRVTGCPDDPACVRLDHLSVQTTSGGQTRAQRSRAGRGTGSKRELRPGVWKLAVTEGTFDDGTTRRSYKTVHAKNAAAAERELAAFVTELRNAAPPPNKALRDMTVDEAVELYLTEHLAEKKGRERKTIDDYRRLHAKWFAAAIGKRRVRDVDEAIVDRAFGRMRRAGLSRSRLNSLADPH